MYSKRSDEFELLDLGPKHYTPEEYADCMDKLSLIGRYLGGNRATLQAFDTLPFTPQSILDVGCGGGHFTRLLAEKYPEAHVVGIDTSHEAIHYSQQHKAPNLSFEHRGDPRLNEEANRFDVVTASLVCHHLSDEQLVEFLKAAHRIAGKAIIINDLHRHPLASFLFKLVTPVCFNNRLVSHDGPISIRRAFDREDWNRLLKEAGFSNNKYQIRWRWAFRWIVTITTT